MRARSLATMFNYAYAFNQDISNWAVHSVRIMSSMFYQASSFNQDLSDWAVRVTGVLPRLCLRPGPRWCVYANLGKDHFMTRSTLRLRVDIVRRQASQGGHATTRTTRRAPLL